MAPLNTDSPAVFESYQINKHLPLLSTGIFGTTVPSKSCCVFTKLCSAGWRWQNVQQSPWRFGSALPTQVFFFRLGTLWFPHHRHHRCSLPGARIQFLFQRFSDLIDHVDNLRWNHDIFGAVAAFEHCLEVGIQGAIENHSVPEVQGFDFSICTLCLPRQVNLTVGRTYEHIYQY